MSDQEWWGDKHPALTLLFVAGVAILIFFVGLFLSPPPKIMKQQQPMITTATATTAGKTMKVVVPAELDKGIRIDIPGVKLNIPPSHLGKDLGSVTIPDLPVGEKWVGVREGIWFRRKKFLIYTTATFCGSKDGDLWEIEVVTDEHYPSYTIQSAKGYPFYDQLLAEWRRWYSEEYLPRQTKFPPTK